VHIPGIFLPIILNNRHGAILWGSRDPGSPAPTTGGEGRSSHYSPPTILWAPTILWGPTPTGQPQRPTILRLWASHRCLLRPHYRCGYKGRGGSPLARLPKILWPIILWGGGACMQNHPVHQNAEAPYLYLALPPLS
jgi:hypothetical protein